MVFPSFISENIQIISSILIVVMFLLMPLLLWFNRKIFFNLFKNINRTIIVLLLILVVTFSLICIFKGLNFKSFIPSDQEWEILRQAKGLVMGEQVFDNLRYGLVYPLLLSFGFGIFGFNPLVASVFNLILATLSILLIFALSQAIFKNSKISLLSAFIYAFTPLVFVFASLQMGFPTIVTFFLLSFVLVSVLYFQYHKTSLLILSLLLIALTSQIKPEYFVLIIPFGLCFLFFKEYKQISLKKTLILIILFFIFSTPYFIKNAQFKESFSSGWCGYPSQTFYGGERHSYSLPIADQLDKVLKFLINNRFSVSYLIYKLPNFAKFWTFRSSIFISILILIGILSGFKKNSKEYLYIVLAFFSISFLYLADCALFETRYAIPTYGLAAPFAGFGLNFASEKITQFTKRRHLLKTILLIIIALSISLYWYLNDYRHSIFEKSYYDYLFTKRTIVDDYSRLKNITQGIPADNSNFIVVHPNEEKILRFLGYRAIALVNIESLNQIDKYNPEITELPLSLTKDNYFIKSWYCQTLVELKNLCNFVTKNYSLKLEKKIAKDKLYSFVR